MNFFKEKIKRIDKYYFLIFVVSLVLLFPLLNRLYFYGHDTGYHIANVLAISENLSFHNLFHLKIFPMIANDFGYGSGIFYPQLAHIVTAFIFNIVKHASFDVFTAVKISNFFCIFLSNLLMYKLLKNITKNKKLSFVASLFYMTAGYKIYDYLVRDAIAESFVFIFIPMVFLGIYYLFENRYRKFYFYFVLGYVGLINCHLIMTIYFTIFLAILLLIHFKEIWNKTIMRRFITATILVILLCLPFIIPLITHKLLGSYVVFSKNAMANPMGVYGNGLSYAFLIGDAKKIGYHFLNYVALGLAIYLVIQLKKEKKFKKNFFLTTGLVFTFVGIWMSSLLFPWFLLPNFLLMIQFPWRLGAFTAFGLSILSFYALEQSGEKQKLFIKLSICSCILGSVYCLMNQKFQTVQVSDYDLTTIGMGWQQEYLPVKTKENITYFENRDQDVHLISGKAEIEILENDTPDLTFKVMNEEKVKLELPRLYYLGYTIKTISEEGEEKNLSYTENENGFIEIEVDSSATIDVSYTNTKAARVGNLICMVTLIGFVSYLVIGVGKNEKGN